MFAAKTLYLTIVRFLAHAAHTEPSVVSALILSTTSAKVSRLRTRASTLLSSNSFLNISFYFSKFSILCNKSWVSSLLDRGTSSRWAHSPSFCFLVTLCLLGSFLYGGEGSGYELISPSSSVFCHLSASASPMIFY